MSRQLRSLTLVGQGMCGILIWVEQSSPLELAFRIELRIKICALNMILEKARILGSNLTAIQIKKESPYHP